VHGLIEHVHIVFILLVREVEVTLRPERDCGEGAVAIGDGHVSSGDRGAEEVILEVGEDWCGRVGDIVKVRRGGSHGLFVRGHVVVAGLHGREMEENRRT